MTGGEARSLTFNNTIALNQYGVDNSSAFSLSIGGTGTTTLTAAQSWSVTGSGNTVFGKTIANGGYLFTLDGSNTGTGTISSDISGSGGIAKSGTGTWTLSGANSYTGDTVIKAGILKLDGAGSLASSNIIVGDMGSSTAVLDVTTRTGGLIVASGQTLKGIGTVNGSTIIQSGGSLAPGNSSGILNTENITLDAGSIFNLELGGTTAGAGYDQLNVTGSANLAGLLAVSLGSYTPQIGDMFFVLANDSDDDISGRFSNAAANGGVYSFGGQDFQISYFGNYEGTPSFTGGNDVVLKAVAAPTHMPEPSSALLGGLGALCLLRRRRDA